MLRRALLACALMLVTLLMGAQPSFTVGQYNIRYDARKDVKKGNGWEQRRPHIISFINYQQWDVVGLQEVLNSQLDDLMAGLDGYAAIGVGRDNGKQRGEYTPILYRKNRMRCLESGTFWLSEKPDKAGSVGWDAAVPRICTWAQFEDMHTGWRFWMFNVHMDHVGTMARREGAKLVMAKVEEMCGGEPYLLTGDLNVDQHDEIYAMLTAPGMFVDAIDKASRRYVNNGTTNAFSVNRYSENRIDHIFVSERFDVHKYGILPLVYWALTDCSDNPYEARMLSDHYPVEAVVELPHLRIGAVIGPAGCQ